MTTREKLDRIAAIDADQEREDRWLRRYLSLAFLVAGWSKDPSTKVGAVVVGVNTGEIAIGYNGFPPGVADTEERLNDKPTKYAMIQHAERNVLDNARFDLRGAMLVTTMFPCHECAKSIISRGIKTVACPPPLEREPWLTSSKWTREMFAESGVSLIEL